MPRKGYYWVYNPPKPPKLKVPEEEKNRITNICEEFIKTILKPKFIIPNPEIKKYCHIEEIFTKWWKNYFYFYAKYHYTHSRAIEEFLDQSFARLEYINKDKFNLSYMRHTNQWWEIYSELSLEECLKTIKEMPHFHP